MRKLFTLCLLVFTLSASAQWQQTGSKVRYVNGLGIPTRDTAAGTAADSSQILIRPADSALYVKYKRTWLRVGGGGGSIAGSGTTNYIPKFTSSSAIGNSQIFDNGTNVGIGTTSPGSILDIREANRANSTNITNLGIYTTTAQSTDIGGTIGLGGLFNGSNIAPFGSIRGGKENSTSGNYDGYLAFQTIPNNGTLLERMRISSTGNVGIGTASPAERLEIVGNVLASGSAGLYPRFISTVGAKSWEIGYRSGTTNYEIREDGNTRMVIANGGNVGINQTAPAGRFVVADGQTLLGTNTNNGTDRLQVSGNINAINGLLQAGNGTIRNVLTYATEAIVGTTSNHDLILYSNNIDRGRITKGGNILLGTTTDNGTDRLQVSGSASVTSLFGVGTSPSAGTVHIKTTSPSIAIDDNDNTGTAAIRFRPQSASFATKGSIELVSTGSAAPTRFVIASTDTMTFRTNNVERMRVTSAGGNVLISKTTDNGIDKLQVNGSIDAKGFAQAYTAKGSTYTATTSDYLIDCTSGTFTVNLPDALLNVGRILIIKNSGTGTITVDGNGSQTIDGATTYSLSAQWATVQIMCDGGNWKILAKF